ncbi:unnamed protein product [Echinostoma caproni]|uniref:TP53RK-binding protein n=1 Tax=Echinostoma caproni TaxID=27848 RepID=A0A3P8GM93_9TREM|nr:unnamed protein product [Echinostoma caproni]
MHKHAQRMITRDLATEVIYCLSPTRALNRALNTFSVKSTTKRLVVVLVRARDPDEPDLWAALETLIQGTPMDPDTLTQLDQARRETLYALYGITSPEADYIMKSNNPHETLRESILTRMSVRDLCRA